MAKRVLSVVTLTPTATADTADLVDNTYHGFIRGGAATQKVTISEVMETGQAGASTPTLSLLAASSQAGTGAASSGAGVTDAPLDSSVAALAAPTAVGNQSATLKPRRSATAHLLNLAFNAFGGIVRWVAAPGSEIQIIGASNNTGEVTLSAFTGGTPGLMGSHIIYEAA